MEHPKCLPLCACGYIVATTNFVFVRIYLSLVSTLQKVTSLKTTMILWTNYIKDSSYSESKSGALESYAPLLALKVTQDHEGFGLGIIVGSFHYSASS